MCGVRSTIPQSAGFEWTHALSQQWDPERRLVVAQQGQLTHTENKQEVDVGIIEKKNGFDKT